MGSMRNVYAFPEQTSLMMYFNRNFDLKRNILQIMNSVSESVSIPAAGSCLWSRTCQSGLWCVTSHVVSLLSLSYPVAVFAQIWYDLPYPLHLVTCNITSSTTWHYLLLILEDLLHQTSNAPVRPPVLMGMSLKTMFSGMLNFVLWQIFTDNSHQLTAS
jgi:hypothetical protein